MITLHQGDCLKIIPQFVPDESVDLIYIDPPFYTGHNFDTFTDKWLSMDTYVRWLKVRLQECYRVLKPTGSIYVHLDWHAVHYVKVKMDDIFGIENFRNEIVWSYNGGGTPKIDFPRKHDTILRYTKNITEYKRHGVFNTEYCEYGDWVNEYEPRHSLTSGGKKVDLERETPITDVWADFKTVTGWSPEKLNYPTQKPEALLERIIKASSNPGDLILDPMCGCGTALAVANKLGRRYVGIDLSEEAIALSTRRLSSCQSELKSAT